MKHEQALGKNGLVYYPKDIFNINKLVDMRYHGLTDLDKQFELIAVNGEKKKYFRFKHSPGKDLTRSENNPSHEKVKNELFDLLLEKKSLRVYTNEFINYTNEDGEEVTKRAAKTIINLTEGEYSTYSWKKEAFKRTDKEEYTLFDICGFPSDVPFATSAKPIIIFELIVSHFVKEPVFKFLCNDSDINYTLAFFIYIPENTIHRNNYNFYWNEINEKGDNLSIRITQFIDNGYFHSNEHPIKGLGDESSEDIGFIRPHKESFSDLSEYWEKHYLFVKERYFKTAIKKLKQ